MADDLKQRITSLDDYRLLRFFRHLSDGILDGLKMDRQALLNAVPDSSKTGALAAVLDLPAQQANAALGSNAAVECARGLLLLWADQPASREALRSSLDTYRDDEMVADVILQIGLAATMILLTATTRFTLSFKGGKLSFALGKQAATAEMVGAVTKPLAEIADKIVGSGKAGKGL